MNRIKIILVIVVAFGITIAILLYNKSRSEAKSRTEIMTSVPVSVIKVERKKLTDSHLFTGIITASRDVAVVSETQGKITAVMAEVGEYKQANSVLIQVDDEVKKANLATAEVNFEKHLSTHDALHEAGRTRLRPILMTTASMIVGMLPIALSLGSGSEWKSGLAWALIGGLTSSLFLTLILVPIVYLKLDQWREKVRTFSLEELLKNLQRKPKEAPSSVAGVMEFKKET